MEYIQKVFLGVENYMQQNRELEELIAFLNSEPPEFRSIGYESASMQIGLKDLAIGMQLNNWEKFYRLCREVHPFHMEMGLGWAFAKAEISPLPFLRSLHPFTQWMVFDGMGYYHGLFKGRRTVKSRLVPEGIEGQALQGYDQGLGRRLWYIAKGVVEEITRIIEPFTLSRHPDLWRGVGIACGYVGGNEKSDLEALLLSSGDQKRQLRTGVALAAMSRNASGCVTEDIGVACSVICGMQMKDAVGIVTRKMKQFDSVPVNTNRNWIQQLEAEFS